MNYLIAESMNLDNTYLHMKNPALSRFRSRCHALCTVALLSLCAGAVAKDVQVTPETLKNVWANILPGDRVLFSPGEYRDTLSLPANRSWSASTPTVFVATTSGKVVIKGSDIVQGWVEVDGVRYVKDWGSEPAQVFVDGVSLTQLAGSVFAGYPDDPNSTYNGMHKGSGGIWPGRVVYTPASTMPINSFFYDKTERKLYLCIRGNPNQKRIEVSVRGRLFYAEGVSGIVLERLVFEHSNTSVTGRGAAVTIIGNDNVIRGVTVRQTDLAGLQMVGDRNHLLDSVAQNNGQLGVAMRGTNNRVMNVDASYNNTRGFNKWWEAGGFKFVGKGGLQSSEVIGNTAVGNYGDGIWFDWKNKNNTIRKNVAAYNSGFGIHYEASRTGVIQDNYVYGNGQRGIYLSDSANCWVTHNMVVGNGLEGIVAVFSGRDDEKNIEFGAEGNKVYANIIGWNKGAALIMPKGIPSPGESDGNVYFANPKMFQISLGYPSLISPALRSLDEWKKRFGLDGQSVVGELPMPTELSSALSKQVINVDWSGIQSLAGDLKKSKGASIAGQLLPGRQEDVIGPRK
jgi:parallel beta-helix repeat protein